MLLYLEINRVIHELRRLICELERHHSKGVVIRAHVNNFSKGFGVHSFRDETLFGGLYIEATRKVQELVLNSSIEVMSEHVCIYCFHSKYLLLKPHESLILLSLYRLLLLFELFLSLPHNFTLFMFYCFLLCDASHH